MTGRVIRQFAEDLNAAVEQVAVPIDGWAPGQTVSAGNAIFPAEPEAEPQRTTWKQPLSKKEISPGDAVATCGHVEAGGQVFTFDGWWKHEDVEVCFMACCPACAVASNYDLGRVKIVDVVVFE